jgi:predicted RNA-binding protein with TRAM domain
MKYSAILLPLAVASSTLLLVSCGETMAFRDASGTDTIEGYTEYLQAYPEGDHVDDAYRRVEDLFYEQAVKLHTAHDIDRYLKEYPKGRHVTKAKALKVQIAYDTAQKADTIAGYVVFIREFPTGPSPRRGHDPPRGTRLPGGVPAR